MWKAERRASAAERRELRHPNDLSGAERALVALTRRRSVAVREAAALEANPSAAIIDSPAENCSCPRQSAKAAQKGVCARSTGLYAGKKVTGRKRRSQMLDRVDTVGLLPGVSVLPADIQDRDGSRALPARTRRPCR